MKTYDENYFEDWLSSNKDELLKEFFKENKEGFPAHATYQDVNDYYPDEFLEYAKQCFKEDMDNLI